MTTITTNEIDFANAISANECWPEFARVGGVRHGKPVDGWSVSRLRDPDGPHGGCYWWFTVADDGELLSCGDATIGRTNPPVQYERQEWMHHPAQWDRAAELAREMLAELQSVYVVTVQIDRDSIEGRRRYNMTSGPASYVDTGYQERLDYALLHVRRMYGAACGYGDAVIVSGGDGVWQVVKSAEPGAPIVATIERRKRLLPPDR